MKMNALEHPEVARALYKASMAGVKVDLIVRDSCRVRPGVPGLSESMRVVSIVGRFLEHARIFYFRNGGDERWYIGSADLMQRNLEARVEQILPVRDEEARAYLRLMIDEQLADDCNAWEMRSDGSYVRRMPSDPEHPLDCQQALIDHAERAHRNATRLRRRKPRGAGGRHLD